MELSSRQLGIRIWSLEGGLIRAGDIPVTVISTWMFFKAIGLDEVTKAKA